MSTSDERFQQLIERIKLLEKHVTRQWVEEKRSPDVEEIKILRKELQKATTELQDLYRTLKVFKTL